MIERRTWVQPQAIMVSGLCPDRPGVVSPYVQSSLRAHTGPPSSPATTNMGLGHRFADCNKNDWVPGPFAWRFAQPLASARRATVCI
jgi:hypothetical protein